MEFAKLSSVLIIFVYIKTTTGESSAFEWEELTDDDDVSDETRAVEAVLGKIANLPCDIESKDRYNIVYMVLWFKKNDDKPIYSFDARGRPAGHELHWSDERSLGPRAYFATFSRPASLQLDNVQLLDEGTYRCRVDYRNAPTKNFQINLTIIVPPHQAILYDNSGREIQNFAGPLQENENLIVICEVRGGKPPPLITWSLNQKILQNRTKSVEMNVVTSKLEIRNLKRKDYDNVYECTASNTNLIAPIQKRVQLKLYLKPLYAKIIQKYTQIIANQIYTFMCETSGSRPAAIITWWKMDAIINTTTQSYQNVTETATLHTINFAPKPEDDNVIIKCQSANPKIDKSNVESSFRLNVVYPPIVSLQLGNKLDSEQIKENDDVYFECRIRANPPSHKIIWYHNRMNIIQNVSSGIILSGQSLVLQRINRHNSGVYTCQAINTQGETTSEPVSLHVKYVPVCRQNESKILGASLDDIVHVVCSVVADPPIVTFKWIFNNSLQSMVVPKEKIFLINSTASKLVYKLSSNRDFGTLTCWTKNTIGEQIKPCTFFVARAARPNAVTNCTFETISKDSVHQIYVQCVPGFNGGLSQQFHLEISRQNRTIANLSTAQVPMFQVDLSNFIEEWQSDLQFVLYSSNIKGRSELTVIQHQLSKDIRTKIVAELTMVEQNKSKNEIIALSLIVIFSCALAITGSFFAILLTNKWCCFLRKTKPNTELKCEPGVKLNSDSNDDKLTISYKLKTDTPDILNKVSKENEQTGSISFDADFDLSKNNDALSRQQNKMSECLHDRMFPKTEDKCSLFVSALLNNNEQKVTCRKIENISSSQLTDTIFGPESSV